jgi:hypothetical protein
LERHADILGTHGVEGRNRTFIVAPTPTPTPTPLRKRPWINFFCGAAGPQVFFNVGYVVN